jgi:CubicO group peptidase (beta-lactamase class C family)
VLPSAEAEIRRADPEDVGLDPRVLEGSLARLCEANATRAAALVVRGRLVWERYWDGCDASTRFCAFSVTKALVACAIGLLQADGALSLDDPACRFLTEWAGDARRAITIRHLLTMTSGLALDFPRFLAAPDPTAAALAWPLMHEPGAVWCYEQATAQALAPIIARASGREPFDLLRARLFDPIGAASIEVGVTETGAPMAYSGALTTARDLTRVGELLLARGRFHGRALLDERFVGRMIAVDPITRAARADPLRNDYRRRGYGLLVDTNVAGMWPGVGLDAFALVGAWGSVCLVDPTHDFVFVRLVVPEGRDAEDDLDGSPLAITDHGTAMLWRAVLAAFDPGASLLHALRRRARDARLDARGALVAWARRHGITP